MSFEFVAVLVTLDEDYGLEPVPLDMALVREFFLRNGLVPAEITSPMDWEDMSLD